MQHKHLQPFLLVSSGALECDNWCASYCELVLDIGPRWWYNAVMAPTDTDLLPYSFPADILSAMRKCTVTDKGCWEYPSIEKNRFAPQFRGKSLRRLVFEYANGRALEPNEKVFHTCGTSKCLNPLHLIATVETKRWYRYERRINS